jgi:hypothetical protein
MMRWGICGLLLVPGVALGQDAGQAGRVVVPISQTLLPNGDIRYAVPVRVGDSVTVPALLDTGSTGLRVMRGALFSSSYQDTGFESLYEFGGGDRLTGTIGEAVVSVGGLQTGGAVPIEVVNQASCADFRPVCSASMVSARDYGIGGDGIAGQGFQAILGVSLTVENGASYTPNPLTHIGARRWIIELPEPGQGGTGSLILNPDDSELQGFQMFQLGVVPSAGAGYDSGWVDTLPGCLNDATNGQDFCGPAILDTGSPGIIADMVGGQTAPLWDRNDHVTMSFSAGNQTVDLPFVADRNPGTGLLQEPAQGNATRLLDGFLPFFYFDVLYDAANGQMGLRARPDAPAGVTAPELQTDDPVEVIQLNAPGPGAPASSTPSGMKLPVVITPSQ